MRKIILLLSLLISAHITTWTGNAQIQIGTIRGTITDQADALVPNSRVSLENSVTGFHDTAITRQDGGYVFYNVPFGSYTLHADVRGFQPGTRGVSIRSNIPVIVDFKLSVVGMSNSVTVRAGGSLVRPDSSSTETTVDESFIRLQPNVARGRQLQNVVATTPGWRVENDGLLHIRGVDDGTLYVIDGIPVTDRLDVVSGNSYNIEAVRSLNVITGNIPAEFGGRSGAVVTIQSRSMADQSFTGTLGLGGGNFRAGEVNAAFGGSAGKKFGFFVTANGNRSDRFLDPVDFRNFNNRGGTLRLNARADWEPAPNDLFLLTFSANGTDFRITNNLEQELAGQRQRQHLRDDGESVRWQHVWSPATVTDVAYFRQSYSVNLTGSPFDTPLFAGQDRRDVRQGVIASLTHMLGGHTLKAGIEASHVSLSEFFTFAVTDKDEAEENDLSDAALEFDLDNPFVFHGRTARGQFSGYLQDTFSPFANLTINAGVRFDHTNLLVSDQQFSPRLGAVYYIPRTRTALRGSFNRLYMPPQVENLLLASSEEARQLSPFATNEGGGSAVVRPEKVSAWEVGFNQDVFGLFRLDGAYWYRSFRNFDDPNVFFNTTVIFPNSVAEGFARGIDARLDFPELHGWSAYLSYGNARVLQTGPINGGLFLTDDFIEAGPGVRFIPDHDVRNSVSWGLTYNLRSREFWASLSGRYESGVPLEVDSDQLDELRSQPGSALVDFNRGRVKPWNILDFSAGWSFLRKERVTMQARFDVENLANREFVYNFGNPFSGTHFGYPRLWNTKLVFLFR